MNKLVYKFEDGTKVTTLAEAKEKNEKSGLGWEVVYEFEPLPARFVQDGVDWDKTWKTRTAAGARQTDLGNLAAKGYFKTSAESLKQKEEQYKKYVIEAQKRIAEEKQKKREMNENV